ncbi:flavin reductase (DIM6/NTAB) family NADH-FMN oxidoreductase RutF [Psychrobacillus insolitus]|uniref:Flavin reductase (DIM6/NTAB) family NADH-FMN oxidoreductase RutF n=1 Tax=Psychrobacillus insolitus TaxID=1461 RepID=A0A2W7MDY0_9BACI|nr:flavin reductase family protein [Psychrobacillus insolitus]PZX03677.1 flavin reductase (DIM6/NTAB) family NADH-FMN oxidoreductase RutF [Psychrobacillus insolitus]
MNATIEKQDLFKEALGNYPTGVTIVTTTDENNIPLGLTVNSFASVSLDPLLVLWSIDHKVSSREAFENGGKFAIHILAGNQSELCKTFASKDVDRFASCNWALSPLELPVIEGAFAVLECETYKTIEAGDHTILIGAVQNIQVDKELNPMLYHRRHFGEIPAEFYS